MCSILGFDPSTGTYSVLLLSQRNAATGRCEPAAAAVSAATVSTAAAARSGSDAGPLGLGGQPTATVPASQLHVALHHLGTEAMAPIVGRGPNPLDVAAGVLAGAPTALQEEAADDARREASGDSLGLPAGAAGMTSSIRKHPHPSLAPGTAVRIVRRPEQWARDRLGRVSSWDEAAGRYMVLLPARHGEQLLTLEEQGDDDVGRATLGLEIPLHCLPEQLECVMDGPAAERSNRRIEQAELTSRSVGPLLRIEIPRCDV